MALDTLTIALSGEVTLDRFKEAVRRFYDLVNGLSTEEGASDVLWIIDDLNPGSAVAVVRGLGPKEKIERVVRQYGEVGVAIEQGKKLTQHSDKVRRAANGLRRIAGGRIESVRLETPEREAILRPTPMRRADQQVFPIPSPPPLLETFRSAAAAYGAVEGRVQTLSNRGGLRFTLYDTLNDKAVSCYLAEGYENIMRDAWGRLAVVEGLVSRDPLSGRPLAVRRVRDVTLLPERSAESYQEARGSSPSLTDLLPEQAIRRLRDA
jgi:hypothetical protein